jgi:uncharacterized protein involved in exopolysaccharide biosynthesis
VEEAYTTSEYLATLRRRKGVLFASAFLIVLAAIAIAFGLPPVYRSSGTILVEQQEIPLDFVRSTVTSYATERIQIISQRVMSRAHMTEIVEAHDLVDDPSDAEAMDRAVAQLRESTVMEMIDARVINQRTGNESRATIAFSVSYDNSDPVLARNVTRDIVDLYLQQNLADRTESAAETTSFLTQEVALLSEELNETERELATFKQANADSLPSNRDLTLQYIDRAERELAQLDRDIRELRQSRSLLEVELSQISPFVMTVIDETGDTMQSATLRLQELQAEYLRLSSMYSDQHPDLVSLRKEIELLSGGSAAGALPQLEMSLQQRTAELELAEQRYSAEHPDVLQLRRSVRNLEAEVNRARANAANRGTRPNNPEYIALQVRLEAARDEVEALSARRMELLGNISVYDARLGRMPEVERELLTLTREYDLAKQRYNEMREQQREARLSETLESESKGERFTVLDPPRLPLEPVSPNRPAIVFLGIVLALAMGVGLAALTEALDGTVRSVRDLRSAVDLPPLAVIPYVDTREDARRRFVSRIAYGVAAMVCVWGVTLLVTGG